VSAGKVVGKLTSPTESLTLRSPIGLSLIRREVAAGDEVEVRWTFDGEPRTVIGSVHDLPMDDFTNP
jgi:glycine cleavage system aminomethyltransferase T